MFLITAKRWLLADRLSTLWLFGLSIERKLIFALSITQTCVPNFTYIYIYLWRHVIRVKSVLGLNVCRIRTFSYKFISFNCSLYLSNNLFTFTRSISCTAITFFAKFVHQNYPFSYVIIPLLKIYKQLLK